LAFKNNYVSKVLYPMLFGGVKNDISHFFQNLRLQKVVDELISRSGLVQGGMRFHDFGFTGQPTVLIISRIILHGGTRRYRGEKNAVGLSF
jgi:hypothetical protein